MSDDDTRTLGDERRRLMGRLELEFNQFVRNIETCRIRDIEQTFIGEWSLKDIVGHVADWEAQVVTAIRELREGRRPSMFDFDESKLDEWNQDHVERKRDLNFWSVYEQLRGGHQRLVEELDELSDDELVSEGSVYARLVNSVIDHDTEHWHQIAAQLAGMSGTRWTGARSVPEEAVSTS